MNKNAMYGLGGLLFIVGLIFLFWMIGTMVEFQTYLNELKQEIQMYYPYNWETVWNSPQVRNAISEGYVRLFTDKAGFFLPLMIGGLICIGIGKKAGRKEPMIIDHPIKSLSEPLPQTKPQLRLIMSPREREEAMQELDNTN
jgi:hypothetical protein